MDRMKPFISVSTLLLFTCILPLFATPLPRTLALWHHQASVVEKTVQVIRAREMPEVDEGVYLKERMDLEINDYPGSGANSRHDPKNPGKP